MLVIAPLSPATSLFEAVNGLVPQIDRKSHRAQSPLRHLPSPSQTGFAPTGHCNRIKPA
jgi:hypothetical protein